MIKYIFFDLGSTLIDESACVNARIEAALKDPNAPTREEFMKKVRECAKTGWQFVKDAADFYGIAMPKWDSSLERVYPEAVPTLERLYGKFGLGIIANQSLGAGKRMEERGIRKYFDTVILSAEEGVAKPDSKIFLLALERAGLKPEEAAMVGDRLDNDILPAKALGMTTVWVRQGSFIDEKSYPENIADYTVGNISEIPSIFGM